MATAYFIDNTGLYSSDGRTLPNPKGNELFEFMLADNPRENKLLYDLDACVASIIRLTMTPEQTKILHDTEKVRVGNYRIKYFPNRFFSIDRDRAFVNYGNLLRYKSDTHYSPDDTVEDKVAKAGEAAEVAAGASEILKGLMLDPNRITSPVAAVADKYLKPLALPTVDDYPQEVGELAYNTLKGNWLECYQMGYWEDAWDADINSAYGSRLAQLLDVRRGRWVEDTTMPSDAVYGFAEGTLKVDAPFHPFAMKGSDETFYTPVGSRAEQLPKSMIDLLHKHNLGTFDIQCGFWWLPSETKPRYEPLRGLVKHLVEIRSQSEGLKKAIIRQMLAGIWGRMIQVVRDEFGELFNPVWASIVENDIKVQVADTCLSAGIIPLQVAVDGVITDRPLPIEDSLEMGKWRLSHRGRCIIVSSGVVGFEGKQGAEEFALRFEWLYDQLSQHPEQSVYRMSKYSPITLGKAARDGCHDRLGELDKIERDVVIGVDSKRIWQDCPKNGGDLLKNKYKSAPLDSVMAGAII